MHANILIPSRNSSERAILRAVRQELSALDPETLDLLIRISMNRSVVLYKKVFRLSYFGVEEHFKIVLKDGFVRYYEQTLFVPRVIKET